MIQMDKKFINSHLVNDFMFICLCELTSNNKITIQEISEKFASGKFKFDENKDTPFGLELAIAYNKAAKDVLHIQDFKEFDVSKLYNLRVQSRKDSDKLTSYIKFTNFSILIGSFLLNGVGLKSLGIAILTMLVYPFVYRFLMKRRLCNVSKV